MKTTHQVARELLALPDVPLHIDPEGTAILRMGRPKPYIEVSGHFSKDEKEELKKLGFYQEK